MEKELAKFVAKELGFSVGDVAGMIEKPPKMEMGDFALPCFSFAKDLKKSPLAIAEDFCERLRKSKDFPDFLGSVDSTAGYVNFFVDKIFLARKVLKDAGKIEKTKKKEKVIIDFSHPNVAKHFGIHNLRSTLIGNSLYKILGFYGNEVKSINYLGDWGTQFGKLIVAYKKWGGDFKKIDVEALNKLYVKFHDEAESDESLDEAAREEFKKLEKGDKQNKKLWKIFYDVSMKEFERVYSILNVDFDEIRGESFFMNALDVRKDLEEEKLLKKDEGALVVEMEDENKPPLIFAKSDEATTYASRDLASIYYREKKNPDKILYVVDSAQSLHFEQVFEVAKKLGVKAELMHIKFGRLKFKDFKMSTRKGKVILFEELLKKAEEKSLKNIEDKNPSLKNKGGVARKVALAGIVFNDLKQDRKLDIVFDWDEALAFEGRTGPYLLYSYARASSILKKSSKASERKKEIKIFDLSDGEIRLVKKIDSFGEAVRKASENFAPSIVANYVYELAQIFNEFYHSCNVLGSEEENFRLALIDSFRKVMKKGLNLLGIEEVDEM